MTIPALGNLLGSCGKRVLHSREETIAWKRVERMIARLHSFEGDLRVSKVLDCGDQILSRKAELHAWAYYDGIEPVQIAHDASDVAMHMISLIWKLLEADRSLPKQSISKSKNTKYFSDQDQRAMRAIINACKRLKGALMPDTQEHQGTLIVPLSIQHCLDLEGQTSVLALINAGNEAHASIDEWIRILNYLNKPMRDNLYGICRVMGLSQLWNVYEAVASDFKAELEPAVRKTLLNRVSEIVSRRQMAGLVVGSSCERGVDEGSRI